MGSLADVHPDVRAGAVKRTVRNEPVVDDDVRVRDKLDDVRVRDKLARGRSSGPDRPGP
ncbi:MAG: hypothetical protein ACLP0J_07310 [Solirubrobacteraceae bacterium]|jgi:hypothetical protein